MVTGNNQSARMGPFLKSNSHTRPGGVPSPLALLCGPSNLDRSGPCRTVILAFTHPHRSSTLRFLLGNVVLVVLTKVVCHQQPDSSGAPVDDRTRIATRVCAVV